MKLQVWGAQYFTQQEMACKCGCGRADMDPGFMSKLDQMRRQLGKPLIITSGFRCPDYNAKVSKTGRTGPHTTGHAADIRVYGGRAVRLSEIAHNLGMTGFGDHQKGSYATRFLHVDDLPNKRGQKRPWTWSY